MTATPEGCWWVCSYPMMWGRASLRPGGVGLVCIAWLSPVGLRQGFGQRLWQPRRSGRRRPLGIEAGKQGSDDVRIGTCCGEGDADTVSRFANARADLQET